MLTNLRARLVDLIGDRKGVTTLEYATIAAVTVVATGVGMTLIKAPLTAMWANIAAGLG